MQARRVSSLDVSRSIGSSGGGGGAATTLARHARQVAAMRTRSHSHETRRAIEDMTPGGRSAQDELEVAAMESRDWGLGVANGTSEEEDDEVPFCSGRRKSGWFYGGLAVSWSQLSTLSRWPFLLGPVRLGQSCNALPT
jgi:hypothetical protein